MSPIRIGTVFRRSSGAFVRAARARGIPARSAKTLEVAANEVAPGRPAEILDSRELFEAAATRAVVGNGGNLELSFGLVDELANTVEALGLARASDVPDPFRRVWVRNGAGQRIRGVVLTCKAGELAVFAPPAERSIAEIGGVLWLQYRGFTTSVEYDLQLDDAVRLPGALVLHLKRRSGQGAIGRSSVRHPVFLRGHVRPLDGGDEPETPHAVPCLFTDVSAGGMALDCGLRFEQGARVRIDFPLPDEERAVFTADAVVRWSRAKTEEVHAAGVAFVNLPRPRVERLEHFLRSLSEGKELEAAAKAPASSNTPAFADPLGAAAPPAQPEPRPEWAERPPSAELPLAPAFLELEPVEGEDFSELGPEVDEGPGLEALPGELEQLERIYQRLAQAVTSVVDHPLTCSDVRAERRTRRVAGARAVHVSFKLAFEQRGTEQQGCLLVPLADALSLASGYLMQPGEALFESRGLAEPDPSMKQALLQLGELVAGSIDVELRRSTNARVRASALGCQGVRANVRPAFRYDEGTALLVGRCEARFAEFEPFELILMLPAD